MANTNAINIAIIGKDMISATIDQVRMRITRMPAVVNNTRQSLLRLSTASGLPQLGNSLSAIAQKGMRAFQSIGQIIPVLGVLTGSATLAGIYHLVSAWGEFGSNLSTTAQSMGLSVSSLHGLDNAARLAGVSSSSLNSGIQTLGKGLWDAVGGRNPQLVAAFQTLGVSFQKANGTARSAAEIMPILADRIKSIRNPIAQAAVATEFFGSAGQEMLPFLRLGSQGMAQYTNMARQYGVMNEAGAKAANQLRMDQTRLTLAVEGFGNSVSQAVAPVLSPLIRQMADWIAANRTWIAQNIAQYIRSFGIWLKNIDWAGLRQGVENAYNKILSFSSAIGGGTRLLEILGGLLALRMISPFFGFAGAVLQASAALFTLGGSVIRLGAMFLPMLATPVGLAAAGIGLAIAGITFAGYEMYKHWDEIKDYFVGLWKKIRESFQKGWEYISPIVDKIRDAANFVTNSTLGQMISWTGQKIEGGWNSLSQVWKNPAGQALNGGDELNSYVARAAQANGLDPNIIKALISAESGGHMVGNSQSSAYGYMQLTRATAQDEGVNAYDPMQNVLGGSSHFRKALQAANGDYDGAVGAYHDGLNSSGLKWYQAHQGDVSHFSPDAQKEIQIVKGNYAAERVASGLGQGQNMNANLNIHVNTPAGTKVKAEGGKGLKVAAVTQHRSMDPSLTPHGF
ncbi:phage tail tape measure protein [Entomobacter blattae]|uniref:Transglycosylase SLT domain protein n=1 Tax=Entomobacter blattae TaxID=2762277 RepID=A0A7H1NUI5_9PROT|nr:phage tail tape measure protein [Entomobacter blattae]QNT79445.1 Transglycosylase SLT domain protein [Entomobacter blattae]